MIADFKVVELRSDIIRDIGSIVRATDVGL